MSTLGSEPARYLEGLYYDGLSTRSQAVRIRMDVSRLVVEGLSAPLSLPIREVSITERLGSAPRRLELPGGAGIEVHDDPLLDAIEWRQGRRRNWVAALERRWHHAMLALLGFVLAVAVFYAYGLPWIADTLAARIPQAWVVRLTEATLKTLDDGLLQPSHLPNARQESIRREFAAWASPESAAPPYRLHFRTGGHVGPNALALPAGDIVITDELIALAKNDDELLGVLSHELGHLHHRHTLRQVMRSGLISVAAGIWFGDFSGLASASAALLSLRYTRAFEQDADDYAARMMRANGANPVALARILERLEPPRSKDEKDDLIPNYLQTHPLTTERIRRLKNE